MNTFMQITSRPKHRLACLLLTLSCLQIPVFAAEISGVNYPDSLDLRGSKLQLNGAGVRYKAVFKVYTAGLYLGKKADSVPEVLSQAGNKRISITMLREVDSSELGRLFTRGINDNTERAEQFRIMAPMLRMGQIFAEYKTLKPGDNFTIDWIQGLGTVITIKGKQSGEPFKEPEFFNAMLSIWLGKSPADWKLKDGLLGK
jgi:hypothetical protein